MNIFQRLFVRQSLKAAPKQDDKPERRTIVRTTGWPHWIRGDYSLNNSELIFAAVSRIANSLAAMPMMLYQDSRRKKGELDDLVSFEPNPSMTAAQFFKTMESCRCTYGNCYALKVPAVDRTYPYLYPLEPSRVKPVFEKDSRELWYRVEPEDAAPYYIHNYHILHVPFISSNGYSGVNPLSVLNGTLNYQAQIEEFSKSQLDKGINAQVVLEAPANLSERQRKEMINHFLDTYKDTGGNILLLESGVTAKSINMSPVDSKIFEVEKISRSRVAMVYNIPPHMLGDFSNSSFSSQEEQMLEFLTLTMMPIVTAYEQEFTRKLVPMKDRMKGFRLKMSLTNVLRADAKTMADVHQKAIRGGWMTPNEARFNDNLPADKDGGRLLVARDLTTLEYVINHPDNTALTPTKKEENEDGEHDKPV